MLKIILVINKIIFTKHSCAFEVITVSHKSIARKSSIKKSPSGVDCTDQAGSGLKPIIPLEINTNSD